MEISELRSSEKRNFICDMAIRFINFDRVGYLTEKTVVLALSQASEMIDRGFCS
jgi:hypothetical protein